MASPMDQVTPQWLHWCSAPALHQTATLYFDFFSEFSTDKNAETYLARKSFESKKQDQIR
jgi:hypothetical protein